MADRFWRIGTGDRLLGHDVNRPTARRRKTGVDLCGEHVRLAMIVEMSGGFDNL
jgi:hypothetical protein